MSLSSTTGSVASTCTLTSVTPTPVFVVVESQLSSFGLRPLTVARELGFRTVFLTNDLDRYRDIPAAASALAADHHETVLADTNTVGGIMDAVTAVRGGGVRAVFTICDYNLPLVAEVAAQLGLPTVAPAAAATARNKLQTRRICSAAGVPCPRFVHVTSEKEARAAAQVVQLPCVVKPMTESASVDVVLCRDVDDIVRQFRAIAANPWDARGQRRHPGALVEEYLVGMEVSVESVTINGEIHVLGVTDKLLGPHPYFAEIGDTFPSCLPAQTTDACASLARAALAAIGHDFGAAHTEVKVTSDGPKLVEVNSRVGGDEITMLIELSLGVDLLQQVVRMHAGMTASLDAARACGAASRYLTPNAHGRIRAIHGAQIAARVEGVAEVEVKPHQGALLADVRSNHELLGHVVAVAITPGEAGRRADAALGQLSIELFEESEIPDKDEKECSCQT
jgi:biotin carboxylase